MSSIQVKVGKKYRFTTGTKTRCQVLDIKPGLIPVYQGFADLTIGILEGPNRGMVIDFGKLKRFTECTEEDNG